MDYSTIKHPTHKIKAVYKADGPHRFIVELEDDAWAIYLIRDTTWGFNRDSKANHYTRAKMIDLGWERNMKTQPIWVAGGEVVEPVKATSKPPAQNKPPYYPFKSAEDKQRYYTGSN